MVFLRSALVIDISYPSPSIDYLKDCSLGKKVEGQYMSDADDTEKAVQLAYGIRW